MSHARQRQRRPQYCFHSLEPRQLLNAHLPHPPVAQIVVWPNFKLIFGAIVGVAYTISHQAEPITPSQEPFKSGQDSYDLSGGTSAGHASLTGTDSYSGTLINEQRYKDIYSDGDWALKLRNGSIAQIAYTGSGTSRVSSGRYVALIKGTAETPGGRMYSFLGRLSGNEITGRASLRFRMARLATPTTHSIVS
jgi:hypothetical protein